MHRLLPLFALALALAPARAADAPREFTVGGFIFTQPAGWEWIEPASALRKAELRVVRGKEQADVVFFYFGVGEGGSPQANIDRWLGQFAEPRPKGSVETKEIAGVKVTFVEASGTYQSGMPGGDKTPLADHALLGAILEGPQGSVFVKLTAPKALAAPLQKPFRALVEKGAAQRL
jgi:hypothetical protein